MDQDSGFPCFKGGPRTIQNLRKRYHLSLTEEVWFHSRNLLSLYRTFVAKVFIAVHVVFLQQCVSVVLSLISSSLDAWRTRQYDYYQRVLNGILWNWISCPAWSSHLTKQPSLGSLIGMPCWPQCDTMAFGSLGEGFRIVWRVKWILVVVCGLVFLAVRSLQLNWQKYFSKIHPAGTFYISRAFFSFCFFFPPHVSWNKKLCCWWAINLSV